MKTSFRLTIAAVGLAIFNLSTATLQAQDYTYTTDNGTITITRYAGPGGGVIIPDTIDGLPVTSIEGYAFYSCASLTNVTIGNGVTCIGDWAFYVCSSLTSITIPNSVTSIGDGAFVGTKLTNVTIPNSVTSIGDDAFYSCTSLTNVTIGNSVTNIGVAAFNGCTSLTSVTIGNSVTYIADGAFEWCDSLTAFIVDGQNPVYSSVDGVLFDKSQTTLIQCPGGKAGSYTIPNSVTSIGDHAFLGCSSLTNITIGNNVTGIGVGAFAHCTGLTSITIGNSVSNIGDSAFSGCLSLTSVYFQGNAPSFGEDVFDFWRRLVWPPIQVWDPATIYYLPGTTGWDSTFGGRPTVLWNPMIEASGLDFGVHTDHFGFDIVGSADIPILVEASSDLAARTWAPLRTCTLTNGLIYFSDPQWTNYAARFYRLRSP